MHFIAHFSVFIAYRIRETIIYSKVENCLTAVNRLAQYLPNIKVRMLLCGPWP